MPKTKTSKQKLTPEEEKEKKRLARIRWNKKYYDKTKQSLKCYYNRKEEINKRRKRVQFTCECGSLILKSGKSNHLKSQKHLNFIKNKNNNNKSIECI